ncbi:MAG: DNA polymerase III subunit gamma/tau [Candidatus Cloacimonetes bacterium]|nr:DNA polymerase III subunit gamma/tau [Candidatus Cloacimonadota bacterium]
MTYLVFARKYRPQNFKQLIAQNHITDTLENAIKSDRIAQAFLFTGPRGVGKTSMARILSKALNCKDGPTTQPCNECENCLEITNSDSADVIEIDGASNTGVDDVRRIQNELLYPPQKSQFKIYIIDEVHMLSKNAFNALLKTLEEPPKNVKFIFATTEPHKLPATITSRCQRYDFHRIPIKKITQRIKYITDKENITIEDQAVFLLAKKADGSLRDALSLLDQIVSIDKAKITKNDVLDTFGIVDINIYHTLVKNIINNDNKNLLENLHSVIAEGNDITEFILGLIEYFRNILILKVGIIPEEVHEDDISELAKYKDEFTEEDLLYVITILIDAKEKLKKYSQPLLFVETTLLKLSNLDKLVDIESLESEIISADIAEKKTKNSKPNLKKKSKVEVKKKPEAEIEAESEKEEEETEKRSVDLEEIKLKWGDFIDSIIDDMPVRANYLSNIIIAKVQKNQVICTTKSKLAYQQLNESREQLSNLLTDFYEAKIEFVPEFKKTEEDKFIHSPTLQDIKKHSPEVAEIMKKLDGFILRQEKK